MKNWMVWFMMSMPLLISAQNFERYHYNSEGKIIAMYSGTDHNNFDFVKYYDNGKKMAEGSYLDGKKHGIWKTWNEEGKLTAKARYKHGEKTGKWMIVDESDKNVFHISFEHNQIKEASKTNDVGKVLVKK
jgi:antitoxin component YwqK of YwqJK toxin-antitoxin module